MKFFVVIHYSSDVDEVIQCFDSLQDAISFCKEFCDGIVQRNKYLNLDCDYRIYSCEDKFVSVRYLDNKIFID